LSDTAPSGDAFEIAAPMPQHQRYFMLRCAFLATIGLLATTSLLPAQTPHADAPPAASSPAVETPASPEPMEDARLGDHWTYELRDDITGEVKSTITNTVTDASDSEISTRSALLGNSNFGYHRPMTIHGI